MRMLVTGASGFVGALLAPHLLAEGHHVRALVRDPARGASALAGNAAWQSEVPRSSQLDRDANPPHSPGGASIELVRGDVLTGEGLAQALDGIEVAYYLIHSMEPPPATARRPPPARAPLTSSHSGAVRRAPTRRTTPRSEAPRSDSHPSDFAARERLGALTFATAARRAGVQRIVYLGGLLPPAPAPSSAVQLPTAPSRHLASRRVVEEILQEHIPDSVALRCAIVIGARSRSFRLLVRLVERLPVIALPPWRRFRIQPLDARDAIAMLAAAAHVPAVAGRVLDIGGPEALTYGELLERIAELLLLRRPTLGIGVTLTPLTARLAALLADEDPELIVPLMEGLQCDLLPAADHAAELLGVRLHSLDAAIECALREWEAVQPLAAR